jgi:hypothetical protein
MAEKDDVQLAEALLECRHDSDNKFVRLHTNVDESQGLERVIAHNRFGIAVFASSGQLLATSKSEDEIGCMYQEHAADPTLRLDTKLLPGDLLPMLLVHRTMGGSARIDSTTRGYFRAGATLEQVLHVTNWYEYFQFNASDASKATAKFKTWTKDQIVIDYKVRDQKHGSDVWVAGDDLHCVMKKNEAGIFMAVDSDQCP